MEIDSYSKRLEMIISIAGMAVNQNDTCLFPGREVNLVQACMCFSE